ncbi:hypothetical protein [Moraxella lacunata]|uniref:hypothetical protein n=1 Tax=Moraxella lacunata TaxID=477 RepID=UPI003EE0F41F
MDCEMCVNHPHAHNHAVRLAKCLICFKIVCQIYPEDIRNYYAKTSCRRCP